MTAAGAAQSSRTALRPRTPARPGLPSRRTVLAYAMLTPAVLSVGFLIAYPLWLAISVSIRQGRSMNIARLQTLPIGPANFERLVNDPAIWAALGRSAIYVTASVLPAFLIGLGLAVLLNRDFPGRRWARSLLMLPWAVPGVVAAIAFLWMFDGSYGVVNALLLSTGLIDQGVAWYGRQDTAMLAVVLPTVWKGFPFFTLTLLAAMQAIPAALYEAGRIDGASGVALFRHVTWPGIRGAAVLAVVLNALRVFKDLDIIYATTRGGPAGVTETLSLRVYMEAFAFFRLPSAAALGLMMMAICAVLLSLPRLRQSFF